MKATSTEKLERVKSFAEAGRKLFGGPGSWPNKGGGSEGADHSRMESLVKQSDLSSFTDATDEIRTELQDEGFDDGDINEYIKLKIYGIGKSPISERADGIIPKSSLSKLADSSKNISATLSGEGFDEGESKRFLIKKI